MTSIRRIVSRPLAPIASLFLLAAVSGPLSAQGEVRGRVVEAARQGPVGDAEVRVANLGRAATTDSLGRFVIAGVPAGRHRLEVRRLGYEPVEAEVQVAADGLEIEVQLFIDPQQIAGVTARARPVSARMRAFEDRRARHQGSGRFITREDLSRQQRRLLPDVLRRLPGAHIANDPSSNAAYLSSGRSQGPRALMGPPRACFAQIFVNGVQVYGNDGGRGGGEPPNLLEWDVRNLEAIEYYSSPSSTPPELRTLTAMCGTLVLWTRESADEQ